MINDKYRYVVIGDLIADKIIDKYGYLIKIDGGGSKFNVVSRLALYGENVVVYSGCGKDYIGEVAINSLKKCGVNTSKIIRKGNQTRTYELQRMEDGNYKSTKRNWYYESIISIGDIECEIMPNDILVMDNLTNNDIHIINKFHNNKVLDIGRISMLENLSNEEIFRVLSGKINIIQTNDKVEKYLKQRLGLRDSQELYEFLKPNLLIVTRGKEGADFITGDNVYSKEINNATDEIDSTGAGDAFFSIVLLLYYRYLENEQAITQNFIDKTFDIATKVTSKVVSNMGARGDLYYYLIQKRKKDDINHRENFRNGEKNYEWSR